MRESVAAKALQAVEITYRALTADDATEYMDLRIEALETDGQWFTANREAESAQTMADWARVCTETTERIIFGVFFDGKLEGSTIAEYRAVGIAKWHSTYIRPEARIANTATHLFDLCTEWSLARGLTETVFTVHANNRRARLYHERHRAVQFGQEPMRFADGNIATAIWYRRTLG